MPFTPDIIIFRGAPGTGKSQTAKALASYFPNGVRLEVDTLRQMVISVDWTNQQEHINMLQLSIGIVLDFLKYGFSPIIVIDTFSGDKINKYLDSIYQQHPSLSIEIFGLYATEEELKRRLELRSTSEFKDFPIAKRLNSDLLKWKPQKEVQIDTTGLLPSQTAQRIYDDICSRC